MHLVRLTNSLCRSRGRPLLILCGLLLLLLQPPPVAAQERDAEWMLKLARDAFFHITVKGKLRNTGNPPKGDERFGKAFATGPTLLITSQHVIGDSTEWQPIEASREMPLPIQRAIQPLDRVVELHSGNSDIGLTELSNPVILPSPSINLDAAGISLPNIKLPSFFQLSMCDIVKGKIYSAIMTSSGPPTASNSATMPTIVALKSNGFDPKRFGSLHVFNVVEGWENITPNADGHEGSPILDGDGSVVALISAVVPNPGGGGHLVLATPVQPLIPGAFALLARSPETDATVTGSLKCSLSDTVKRINDQVIAHALWNVVVERDEDGRPSGEIVLRYESVADKPNIKAIKVEYEYFGKQRAESLIRRLQYTDPSINALEIRKEPVTNREFKTSDVVTEGKKLVEEHLKSDNSGGYIDYVELRIYETHLVDKRILKRESVLQFDWLQK